MTNRPTIVRLMPVMDYGGVETIVGVLAEQLPREDYDFRVCTFWNDGTAAERVRKAGIACDVLDTDPRLRNPAAPIALGNYLRKKRPELLHSSISEANFHACIAATAFPRMKLIVEEVGTPARSAKAQRLFGFAYRRADAFIAVSDATKSYLIEEEGAPLDRMNRIYNCVEDRFFDAHSTPSDNQHFDAAIVGRLVEEKNHATLLQAWREVVDVHSESTLHIVGDGPLRENIASTIEQLHLEDHITMHGFVEDMPSFLQSVDVVVLPSIREGYGIALVEAMAQALPVIGSTAGGIPEVLEGYGDRWVLPPTDISQWSEALIELAAMPDTARASLGEHARDLARARFSSDTYIQQVCEVYDSLLDNS